MQKVIESVTLRLAPGISEASFLKASAGVQAFLKQQPGFLSRRIAKRNDGRYTDWVEWRSRAEADSAMDRSRSEPSLAAFMETIDLSSLVVEHHSVVLEA